MEDILMMGSFRCTFEKGTVPFSFTPYLSIPLV